MTGIREQLKRRPWVGAAAASVFVVASVVVGSTIVGGGGDGSVTIHQEAYFSVDDGKSFFVDQSSKVAPFDRNGKRAVAAYVFEGSDGKAFVGYLERAIDEKAKATVADARKKLAALAASRPEQGPDSELLEVINTAVEVKRPGDSQWVRFTSPAAGQVVRVRGPDGKEAKRILP